MLQRYWFLDGHWRLYFSVLLLTLLNLAPPALLQRLEINNAPTVYFPNDAPAVLLDQRVRAVFPNDQVTVLLFEGSDLFSDAFLLALDALGRDLGGHPLVERIWSVTRIDHLSGNEDGFSVEPLVDATRLADSTPDQRRHRAVEDRFARDLLVSADGNAVAFIVVPQTLDTSLQRLELQSAILDKLTPMLSERMTAVGGWIPVDVAELRSMLNDNMTFIPATVLVGLAMVWWMFRRVLALIITGLVMGAVTGSTVALFVVFGQPFTLISTIIPPLLSALSVAALVHLFNAIRFAASRGHIGPARTERALDEIKRPSLFTALTTAAGLGSLSTSPIVPIAVFGLTSAGGVMLIYLLVIHVVPNILAYWDRSAWTLPGGKRFWLDRAVASIARAGIRYRYWTIGILGALLTAGLPSLWEIRVETNLQEFFQPDHRIRKDTDHIQQRMSGTMTLEILFETAEQDGLKDPAKLQFIRTFQTWVEGLAEVDRSASAADVIEEMNWAFHAEDPQFRRVPDDQRLISQYLLIYDGTDLYDFVDRGFRMTRVALNVNVHSAREIANVMERIRGYLADHTPPGMEWDVAGGGRLFADMERLLVSGQVYSLWSALGLVFLLMVVLWRSLGDAVLCMIPNLAPILLIFMVMGFAGIWLDMATAMIASVAVGIAVDDTIHLYHGYSHKIRNGAGPVLALMRTLTQAGRAVVTTTLILSAQFLVLTSSQFVPTANFGLLTSAGLAAALVFDVMLLPALILVIWQLRRGRVRPS